MPKETAYAEAVRRAAATLNNTNLDQRCPALGLEKPANGIIFLRAFGNDLYIKIPGFDVLKKENNQPVKVSDQILVLHYLLCDVPIPPPPTQPKPEDFLSFRQMDSGQFYWPAFLSRSVKPLVGRIGNNLDLLKKHLDRFDWTPSTYGDFSARIHAVGKVYGTLIYHLGDDEFPPSADFLFDTSIKRIYPTEDAAVLAGRICLGLL